MTRSLMPLETSLVRPLRRLENEMSRMMERVLGHDGGWWEWEPLGVAFAPTINLAETENEFEVTVDLPGLKPSDFTIELRDGSLWISGEKKEETEEKGKTYHRIERRYGDFKRVIPLDRAVVADKIEATYRDGVLKIVVPKKEEVKPRHIEVKT